MKIEYNNLYTHFIFITLNRVAIIKEMNRQRIEKYITGIVNNYAVPPKLDNNLRWKNLKLI